MMDILAEVVAYLASNIDAPVSTEKPANAAGDYVVVRRTGGSGDRFLERPRLLVHCWSGSDYSAARLAKAVSDLMVAAPDEITNLGRCLEDSRYQNDVDSQHRWSASFDLVANR